MIRKKIIYGCEARGDGDQPYLTRYTLLQTKRGNLHFHVFHRSDGPEMHDHPWAFISVILWRGYREYCHENAFWQGKRTWPGQILYRMASHTHRVELIDGKRAVTLVWTFKREREWGFFTKKGWQPWKDYFRERGCK